MPALPESSFRKDIVDAWSETLRTLDKYIYIIKEHCFDNILDNILHKVNCFINSENRLTKYDEKIFEYYKHLMWYYYQTINMYQENKRFLTDEKIKKILDGVIIVLSSQLKQFEESQQKEYIGIEGVKSENPIKIEKEMLKSQTDKLFQLLFKKVKNEFELKYEKQIFNLSRSTSINMDKKNIEDNYYEIAEKMYMLILDNMEHLLYKVYDSTVKNYSDKMNNLQIRKAAQFYYESIKQEKENLEIIIKVQVVALENEIATKKLSSQEVFVVQLILRTLREGYQYLGREIEELVVSFKDAKLKNGVIDIIPLSTFSSYIKQDCYLNYINELKSKKYSVDIETLFTDWSFLNDNFAHNINKLISDEINNRLASFGNAKKVYNCKKMIVEKIIMTDEMIACFKEIVDCFNKNVPLLEICPDFEIVSGISETVKIKVDSLYENKKIFQDDTDILIKSFIDEKVDISKEDLENIKRIMFQTIFNKWYEDMINLKLPLDERKCKAFFNQLMSKLIDESPLSVYSEKTKRSNLKNEELIINRIRHYLKEQVLFEMSTFEEINNYSLSRLRIHQEEAVCNFVTQVDDVTEKLCSLLKKHNIEMIKPKPYDMFNGKEHEVLMAEKRDGFSKGQVIKLMNCGYKCDGFVVIRANIVAAR